MWNDIFIFLLIQFFTVFMVVVYYRLKTGNTRDALRKQTEKLEQTSVKLNRTIEQKKYFENDRNNLQTEITNLRKETDKLKQQLKTADTNHAEQEARIEFLNSYRTQNDELLAQIHELQMLLQQTNTQLQNTKKNLDNQHQHAAELAQQNEAMKQALHQLTDIKKKYEQLIPQKQTAEDELANLKNVLATLENDKKQLSAQFMNAKMEITSLTNQVANLETVEKKYQFTLQQLNSLQNSYNDLKQKYELLKETDRLVQVQVAELKELASVYKKNIAMLERERVKW
ncbi:MAG TPA: hypothetical protein PK239_04815 [Chitinophagales bacterium]|nr:hypothetical protein [Chitinophagales bacterium]